MRLDVKELNDLLLLQENKEQVPLDNTVLIWRIHFFG